jgi:hypothetical protein
LGDHQLPCGWISAPWHEDDNINAKGGTNRGVTAAYGASEIDRPKCSLQMEDISSMVFSLSNSEMVDLDAAFADLDEKII